MNRIYDNITKCHADMEVVGYLIDKITDWEKVVDIRHVKFIVSYNTFKRNLKITAAACNYSESDMKSIFWRIQRKLFVEYINRASLEKIKPSVVPEKFNDLLFWTLQQYSDNSVSLFEKIKGIEKNDTPVEKKDAKILEFRKGTR